MSLTLDKEVLRTLSGPDVTMVTQAIAMPTPQMQEINGGGPVSEAISAVISGVASFFGSAAVSVTDSIPSDEAVSAISGASISANASGNLSGAASDWITNLFPGNVN